MLGKEAWIEDYRVILLLCIPSHHSPQFVI